MTPPFFSIAIPSKNRPGQIRDAVQSVLDQTFADLEVVVCDNSDDTEASATLAAVRQFGDARVRYVRANGQLSMPDNWEQAVAETRGSYVGVLTDRSVLYPFALKEAHRLIATTGVELVGWFGDSYGRGPGGRGFRRRAHTGRCWLVESRRLLDYFLHGHPKEASKRLPRLMNAVCARPIIERVRASHGRICPPVCPDYTSAYLMLAHTKKTALVDDALFVSCGRGNGFSFRRRGALADRFVRDLGMTWEDLVDLMPSRACFTTALVLNDFMRVKRALPIPFADYDIDRAQYYLGCLTDYERTVRAGVELFDDYDELLAALNREPIEVQTVVRSREVYVRTAGLIPYESRVLTRVDVSEEGEDDAIPEFDSVFDAMRMVALEHDRMPRVQPSVESPFPMPALTEVAPAILKPKRRPVRQRRSPAAALETP